MADPAASAEQNRTLDRLEQQSEAHRAEFARTVDHLLDRVSPEALRSDVKQRASSASRGIVADFERKVLDNPLQTIAVGAGIAYPAWQVLRNLPAPIMLLGAGVALAGRGTREEVVDDASYYHAGTGASSSTARSTPEEHPSTLAKGGSAASSAVRGATESASGIMSTAVDSVQHAASSAREQIGERVGNGREPGKRNASAYQTGVDTTSRAARKATAAGQASRDVAYETAERYPLVVGGVGLLLGAALAACLPSSRSEYRLFAKTSENIKGQARETAAHAYSEAKAAGERIVENTMDEARQQDLTMNDAEEAVKAAGNKVRAVADRAANSADNEKQT